MDRSDTAKCLIDRSAEAGVADDSGMTALVLMITKMPNVVGGVFLSVSVLSVSYLESPSRWSSEETIR